MGSSKAKRVCIPGAVIVGAGPSGIATAACLRERGVPFLILEKESCVVSSWKMKMYDNLRLHLPKQFCQLPMVPFPEDFPVYPTRQQFVEYVDEYVQRFQIEPVFGVEVRLAEYDRSIGFWKVMAGENEIVCQWLVIATGENGEAVIPKFAGMDEFAGKVLHTMEYMSFHQFHGQRVLVVGCGNSAMEICLDLCNNSSVRTSMVVRNELHILPKEMLGRSVFELSMWLLKWLPIKIVDPLILFFSWIYLGDTSKYGLRRPKIGPLQLKNTTGKSPVLDVGALSKIKLGQIKIFPGIKRLTSDEVEFIDGRKEEFESIILATGYKTNIPSWLKNGDQFFNGKEGFLRNPFPNNWKGENGIYAAGFTKKGLLGISIDAHKIAQDIFSQWDSKTAISLLNYIN